MDVQRQKDLLILGKKYLLYAARGNDKVPNLKRAIAAYYEAYTITPQPGLEWEVAKTFKYVATAYRNLAIAGEDPDANLERAIGTYSAFANICCLRGLTREFAGTLNDLAHTHGTQAVLGKKDPVASLDSAIDANSEAAYIFRQEGLERDLAATLVLLARAHGTQAVRGKKDPVANLDRAITALSEAATFFRKEGLERELVETLTYLANVHATQAELENDTVDNLKSAIAANSEAATICRNAGMGRDLAAILDNLARDHINLAELGKDLVANLGQAVVANSEAATFRQRPGMEPELAQTLKTKFVNNKLGLAVAGLDSVANLDCAIAAYSKAATIFRHAGLERELAGILILLACSHVDQGFLGKQTDANMEHAITASREAVSIFRQRGPERELAEALTNLAFVHLTQAKLENDQVANLESAIAACREAATIRRQPGLERELASTLTILAQAHQQLVELPKDLIDNWAGAIDAYNEVNIIYRQEGMELELFNTLIIQANAYQMQAQLGEDWEANLDSAIDAYSKAETMSRQIGLEGRLAKSLTLLAKAHVFQAIRGDDPGASLDRAIALCSEAAIICRKSELERQLAQTLNYLAVVHLTQAEILSNEPEECRRKAVKYFQEALKFFDPKLLPLDCLATGVSLGDLAFGQGWWHEAISGYIPAIEAIQQARTWTITDRDKQAIQAKEMKAYFNLIQAYINTKQSDKALEVVERSKARNLVELLATHDLYPKGDIPVAILSQLERLQSQIASEQHRLQIKEKHNTFYPSTVVEPTRGLQLATSQPVEPADRSHLVELLKERDRLIQEKIKHLDPSFSLAFEDHPLQFCEIQALLTDDQTALLHWYISDTHIHTFITTRATAKPIVLSSEPQALDLLIKWSNQYFFIESNYPGAWRHHLTESLKRLAEILQLSQLLSEPALDECTRVILIPHRLLHLFPLHALPLPPQNSERPRCLLDRFPNGVCYSPSAQLFKLKQQRQRSPRQKFFALQNPTQDLPYTDLEVEVIQQLFQPHSQVLHHSEANRTALDQTPLSASAHLLHLACHGYFNFQAPLSSALLLSDCFLNPTPVPLDPTRHLPLGENKVVDLSRCITLGDLFSREVDLRHCSLATLSACETGKVDTTDLTDEYVGLPSGFLFAGAASVVSSLWSVNDRSTAFLMIQFYRNLQTQPRAVIALNQAQTWVRDITKTELIVWIYGLPLSPADKVKLEASFHSLSDNEQPFKETFHWAAFIHTGQP